MNANEEEKKMIEIYSKTKDAVKYGSKYDFFCASFRLYARCTGRLCRTTITFYRVLKHNC